MFQVLGRIPTRITKWFKVVEKSLPDLSQFCFAGSCYPVCIVLRMVTVCCTRALPESIVNRLYDRARDPEASRF